MRLEDLAQPVAGAARRLRDLEEYRSRLAALARREDTRVEDAIRLASEISEVQSRIEELTAERRGLDERIEQELVAVEFESRTPMGGAMAPVMEVFARSFDILGRSAAEVLWFVLTIAPWLPFVVLGLASLRFLGRMRRRRPTRAGAA